MNYKIELTLLFDNIKSELQYDDERDDDFFYFTDEKNYDKFNNAKLLSISEFYDNIKELKTSPNNKRKIIKQYIKNVFNDENNRTFNYLAEHPQILKEYKITLLSIDNISLENGWWTKDSKRRHEIYGIIILDEMCSKEGHVYVTSPKIIEYIKNNINNDKRNCEINIDKLMKIMCNKKYRNKYDICISNGEKISLKKYKDAELNLEENINSMKNIKYDIEDLTLNDFKNICPKDKMLSDEQLLAINTSRKNFISAVIGKGGTGKTSGVVKYLCEYITLKENEESIFLTPTHAAKNRGKDELNDVISIEYGTLHAYSYEYRKKNDGNGNDNYNDYNYSDSDSDISDEWTSKLMEAIDEGSKYIIVDEMSMVDLLIFNKFIEICSNYNDLHIILLGDNNQLYPVGVGCPFRDLIDFNMIEITELTKNYRSDGDITPFCEEILKEDNKWTLNPNNESSLTRKYNKEISYNFTNSYDETDEELKKLIIQLKNKGYVPYNYDKENKRTFQIITYKNDDCIEHSKFIRNLYNNTESDIKYVEGDHIIIKKNNSKKNYHNGDEGIILEQTDKYEYKIKYKNCNGEMSEIYLNEIDIKPALARTVHSSQGLQFPIVIYVGKSSYLLDMNINYTAYSRAKSKLILIGNIDCFNSGRVRKKSKPRNTFIRLKHS